MSELGQKRRFENRPITSKFKARLELRNWANFGLRHYGNDYPRCAAERYKVHKQVSQ